MAQKDPTSGSIRPGVFEAGDKAQSNEKSRIFKDRENELEDAPHRINIQDDTLALHAAGDAMFAASVDAPDNVGGVAPAVEQASDNVQSAESLQLHQPELQSESSNDVASGDGGGDVASRRTFESNDEPELAPEIEPADVASTIGPAEVTPLPGSGAPNVQAADGWVVTPGATPAEKKSGAADESSLIIHGTPNDDVLTGNAGDNIIYGHGGDDTIDGGGGNDIAVFSGAWSDYTITESGGVYTVVDNRPGSPDGTDTLTSVELFRFANGDATPYDALNDGPANLSLTLGGPVAENDAAAVIGTVSATDADAGLGDAISYSVDDARFEVVGGQLRLKAGQSLDYESDGASIDVTVTATDVHGASKSGTYTIAITDVDEFDVTAPVDDDAAANSVSEGASNGDTVGIDVSATDADGSNNSVAYTLSDDAGGRFTIDASTGVVTVADASLLNYEDDASHQIEVTATSADGSTSTQTFTIAVSDVDEFDVTAPVDDDAAANSVSEGASNGDTVGIDVSATDADGSNNSVAYTLSDDAGGRFAIDASTGVVTVADASLLNYEDDASHQIEVTATSADGSTSTQTFTISVNDAAEAYTLPYAMVFTDDGVAETSITGTSGSDAITGHDDGATIDGGGGGDTLTGGASADTITGGAGFDTIDGGGGLDFAVFAGSALDYDVARSGSNLIVTHKSTGDIDTLTSIERLQFDDRLESSSNVNTQQSAVNILTYGSGDNFYHGGGGDDDISGGAGDDWLLGGDDDDVLTGDEGDDLLDGGDGTDTAVFEGAIQDYTFSINSDGRLVVTDANLADGDEGSDTLDAIEFVRFKGFDYSIQSLIDGQDGYETGTTGDDFMVVNTASGGTIIGADGSDVLAGSAGNDALQGESISGDAGVDLYLAGAGDDTIWLGDGGDTAYAGTGDDRIYLRSDSLFGATIDGGDGTDTLQRNSTYFQMDASTSLNSIEVLDAATALDVDFLLQGAGAFDLSDVATLVDIDQIIGDSDAQNVDLSGLVSATDIDLGGGDDVVTTGSGADMIYGGDGNDTIDGGDGADTVVFSGLAKDYDVEMSGGVISVTDLIGADGSDDLTNVEFLQFADITVDVSNAYGFTGYASSNNDTYIGTSGGEYYGGGGTGDDIVFSGAGNDTIHAGSGAEYTFAGSGDDTINRYGHSSGTDGANNFSYGGTGDDTWEVTQINHAADYDLTVNGDTVEFRDAGSLQDTLDDIETLRINDSDGSDANTITVSGDFSTTDVGDIEITTADGDDTIDLSGVASATDAVIDGGKGDDTITGGAGDDTIKGGESRELLVNGDFEADDVATYGHFGSITGWTATNGLLELNDNNDSYMTNTASSGEQFVELDATSGAVEGLYQDVTTEAGEVYTLTFDVAARSSTALDTNTLEVYWNGALVASIDPASVSWETYSFDVTGTGGADRLTFSEVAADDDGLGALLDTVSLVSSGGDDILSGGLGDDIIDGGDGDDTIDGGAGDDVIDGGAGSDTAIFSGAYADYTVTDNGDGTLTVTDNNTSDGDDGVDTISNVEFLQFSDQTVATDQAPTDLTVAGNESLALTTATTGETVVTGEIVWDGATRSSVDHWAITHNGGDLVIDVLAGGLNGGTLDSEIRIYQDLGGGSYANYATDDDGGLGADGSTDGFDSYLTLSNLPAGAYILAIGDYHLTWSEGIDAAQTYANDGSTSSSQGDYQITFTGDATVAFAENPSSPGADWGDVNGAATIVSATPASDGGLADGSLVATVSAVDASSGDTHSFTLTDDAGGLFNIDSSTGKISIDGGGSDVDVATLNGQSVTVRVTDGDGATYDETITFGFGSDGVETITGGAGSDVIHGFGGADTIDGGAGDDVIYGGDAEAISWTAVNAGANLTGDNSTNYYSFVAGSGDDATIRFNDSSNSGEGDGVADYVRIETTLQTGTLTIGDFDMGTDKIVLQEMYSSVSSTSNSGYYDITITYSSGNQQEYRIYTDDGYFDSSEVFTTAEPSAETYNTIGGSDTQGETWSVIRLGTAADVDTDETDGDSENASALLGTYGGVGSELYNEIYTASGDDINGNGQIDDNDNGKTAETITIDGTDTTVDSTQNFNATVTFTDGTTGLFSAVVIQTADGDVYLAPELSDNTDNALLTSKPIQSVTLDSLSANDVMVYDDRVDANYAQPGSPDGDIITGGAGDDVIDGGDGDDTAVYSGEKADFSMGFDTGSGEWTITDGDIADGLNEGADRLVSIEAVKFADGTSDFDKVIADLFSGETAGTSANDTLTGTSGDDVMLGFEGDDIFEVVAGEGDDYVHGGAGGSWTDTLDITGTSGGSGVSNSGTSATVGDWTIVLTDGQITGTSFDNSSGETGSLTFEADSDGYIEFDDGDRVYFDEIEAITWSST